MPIGRLLSENDYSPEQRRILEMAFNDALKKLNLVDRDDPICEIVARKVIEVGTSGITDPSSISEIALQQLDPRQIGSL